MKMQTKSQVFDKLAGLGIGIAGLVITLVVTFLVLSQGKAQVISIEGLTVDSAAYNASEAVNATNTLTDAVADIPGWVPLIVIAVIGSILLGLVSLFKRGR